MVVGFTCAISAYITTNVVSSNPELCKKVCQWLATGRRSSQSPPIFSTNKSDRYDITEILFKVALSAITLTLLIGKTNQQSTIH